MINLTEIKLKFEKNFKFTYFPIYLQFIYKKYNLKPFSNIIEIEFFKNQTIFNLSKIVSASTTKRSYKNYHALDKLSFKNLKVRRDGINSITTSHSPFFHFEEIPTKKNDNKTWYNNKRKILISPNIPTGNRFFLELKSCFRERFLRTGKFTENIKESRTITQFTKNFSSNNLRKFYYEKSTNIKKNKSLFNKLNSRIEKTFNLLNAFCSKTHFIDPIDITDHNLLFINLLFKGLYESKTRPIGKLLNLTEGSPSKKKFSDIQQDEFLLKTERTLCLIKNFDIFDKKYAKRAPIKFKYFGIHPTDLDVTTISPY